MHTIGCSDQHSDPSCNISNSKVVDDLDPSGYILDWKSCCHENEMISLVATGNRVTFMGAATISGYECRR